MHRKYKKRAEVDIFYNLSNRYEKKHKNIVLFFENPLLIRNVVSNEKKINQLYFTNHTYKQCVTFLKAIDSICGDVILPTDVINAIVALKNMNFKYEIDSIKMHFRKNCISYLPYWPTIIKIIFNLKMPKIDIKTKKNIIHLAFIINSNIDLFKKENSINNNYLFWWLMQWVCKNEEEKQIINFIKIPKIITQKKLDLKIKNKLKKILQNNKMSKICNYLCNFFLPSGG